MMRCPEAVVAAISIAGAAQLMMWWCGKCRKTGRWLRRRRWPKLRDGHANDFRQPEAIPTCEAYDLPRNFSGCTCWRPSD